MSAWVRRMCSTICQAEYGRPAGTRPRRAGASPFTAESKPAWASSQSNVRAICWRTEVSSGTGSAAVLGRLVLGDWGVASDGWLVARRDETRHSQLATTNPPATNLADSAQTRHTGLSHS